MNVRRQGQCNLPSVCSIGIGSSVAFWYTLSKLISTNKCVLLLQCLKKPFWWLGDLLVTFLTFSLALGPTSKFLVENVLSHLQTFLVLLGLYLSCFHWKANGHCTVWGSVKCWVSESCHLEWKRSSRDFDWAHLLPPSSPNMVSARPLRELCLLVMLRFQLSGHLGGG